MDEKKAETGRSGQGGKNKEPPAGMLNRLLKWASGDKVRPILLIAGLLAIVLLGLSSFLDNKNTKSSAAAPSVMSADDYVAAMEEKLSAIVGSIEGAGPCRVMVTLENGVEYVYATQEKVNTDRQEDSGGVSQRDDTEQNIIVVETENGRQGLLVTEIQPTVKGVVVICEGGDQPLVQERVVSTITTALNISSKRVCVTKMSA